MLLQVDNISKSYKDRIILNNISFSLDKGEIVGFLGPNGAGKSTTMKIISGAILPDKGRVIISGFDISSDEIAVKKRIGYLPENNPLYDEMFITEYLEYVCGFYSLSEPKKERIKNVILQLGLYEELDKPIKHLSKGFRQRVGLAQAIIHEPPLLLLDEATSGLDPNQMSEVKDLLLNLYKDKAILFSSHSLQEVMSICTRIIIIHKGNIVLDKSSDEIEDLEILFGELTKT